jgi:hypothetical protein
VSSHKFAEVLDASGFRKDAFDVAIAGDDPARADTATHAAFDQFVGAGHMLDGISAEEIRFAMLAIASGRALEELRWKIGAALFAILQANADRIEAVRAAAAIKEHFDIDETEFEGEETLPAVFGNSLVHFPKKFRTRGYSPLSSRSLP